MLQEEKNGWLRNRSMHQQQQQQQQSVAPGPGTAITLQYNALQINAAECNQSFGLSWAFNVTLDNVGNFEPFWTCTVLAFCCSFATLSVSIQQAQNGSGNVLPIAQNGSIFIKWQKLPRGLRQPTIECNAMFCNVLVHFSRAGAFVQRRGG